MYRKSPGVVGVGIILLLSLLLAGCTPVQPEKVDRQPQAAADDQEPTVEAFPTLTPSPAFIAGCKNVKSVDLNIGASIGNRVCVEGIVDKITISSQSNRAIIEFDTATGKSGGSLYSVSILIQDTKAFGLDTLNGLVQGERIAVNGLFGTGSSSLTYVAAFIIEVTRASDMVILT